MWTPQPGGKESRNEPVPEIISIPLLLNGSCLGSGPLRRRRVLGGGEWGERREEGRGPFFFSFFFSLPRPNPRQTLFLTPSFFFSIFSFLFFFPLFFQLGWAELY